MFAITQSLLNRIEYLNSEELLHEAVTPALHVYVQSQTALRVRNVADLKLVPFRGLNQLSHLSAAGNNFEDEVRAIEARRNAVRKRITTMGIKGEEIKEVGYSTTANGEIYAFVVTDKKLTDKDRHIQRTQQESDAVDQVRRAGVIMREIESLVSAGRNEVAAEKLKLVQGIIADAQAVMKSDAFKSADMKRKLKDTGRDYVYFIVNEVREGKRGVSTVYESQLPLSGSEFIAYKVVIGTKKAK